MASNRGQHEERSESINLSFFAELTCELSNNRIKEIKLSYQVFADVLHPVISQVLLSHTIDKIETRALTKSF